MYMEIEQLIDEVPTQLDESNLKEQLNNLVSSGKCKEMIGKELTHEQVNKLSEEEVKKFHKRYEAALASKTTDAVADSAIKLATKLLGLALPIDDVEQLRKDISEDYVIAQELKITCGWLSLKCGKLMAVASAALHVAQHVDLKDVLVSWKDFKKDRDVEKVFKAALAEVPDQVASST
ncbi:uncharacterized protein LOC116308006 [Actinia tenebrosa]|uniref:Uncharacterized protein LOC116308006 n=1 Tax=Actinia tenebrosa TaxID=6105 RepID=A0A6P8JCB0_ACTTE|nr:uncharacterized protein LOC116308006 [Actinia tenebrosa]